MPSTKSNCFLFLVIWFNLSFWGEWQNYNVNTLLNIWLFTIVSDTDSQEIYLVITYFIENGCTLIHISQCMATTGAIFTMIIYDLYLLSTITSLTISHWCTLLHIWCLAKQGTIIIMLIYFSIYLHTTTRSNESFRKLYTDNCYNYINYSTDKNTSLWIKLLQRALGYSPSK